MHSGNTTIDLPSRITSKNDSHRRDHLGSDIELELIFAHEEKELFFILLTSIKFHRSCETGHCQNLCATQQTYVNNFINIIGCVGGMHASYSQFVWIKIVNQKLKFGF